jgi:hypothetical protein
MGIFGSKKKENPPQNPMDYGTVFNWVRIDHIDGKPMEEFYWKYSDIKKGLLAPKVEIVYLEPGTHIIAAHGVTYQRETTTIEVEVKAGGCYTLGSGSDDDGNEGLFFEER